MRTSSAGFVMSRCTGITYACGGALRPACIELRVFM